MVPVRLRNHIFVLVDALHAKTGRPLSHEQFAARIHKDTNTDEENNND